MAEKKEAGKAKSGADNTSGHVGTAGRIKSGSGSKIAAIRVRGDVMISKPIRDTLDMLHLHKRNFCAVYEKTPQTMGMLDKVKDHITWGEIDDETLEILNDKRKAEGKKFYRLNPPIKGFGRKGIKAPFMSGGALGYRGDRINELIRRMA